MKPTHENIYICFKAMYEKSGHDEYKEIMDKYYKLWKDEDEEVVTPEPVVLTKDSFLDEEF